MPTTLFPLILSLTAMVCWGVLNFFTAKISRTVGPLVSLFLFQLAGIPMLLTLIPFLRVSFNVPGTLVFAGLGVFDTFIWLLILYSLKVGLVPIVTPLSEISIVVVFALGVIFLHESFSIWKVASIILVLVGVAFLSFNIKALHSIRKGIVLKGVIPALIAGVGVGIYLFLVAPAVRTYGWYNSSLIIRAAITLTALVIILAKKIRINISKVPWRYVIFAALFDVVGFVLFNIAVEQFEVSYVSIITSTSSVVTIILAYFFLKEKLSRMQLMGFIATILGVIFLQIK